MESIDDLLNELKSEYQEKSQPSVPKKQPSAKKEEFSSSTFQPPVPAYKNLPKSSAEDRLLAELKAEFTEQEKAAQLQRQQRIKEEQIKQEKIKQQQKQVLRKEAEVWLKKLNRNSAEGLWFEEFAYDYPDKLDAAIDYLQALKETQS